jgi:hypothetical protein
MSARWQRGLSRIAPAGSKAVKLSGRSLRLWLGDLEASIWGRLPAAYRVQATEGRVLLMPLTSWGSSASPRVVVEARGQHTRRYVYLGRCRAVLEEAGIDPDNPSWVRLTYFSEAIALSATSVSRRNALVCQVQRLRGDGRLWLGSLAPLGVPYRRFLVTGDRRGISLLPTPLRMGPGMVELRGRGRGRYVYLSGAHAQELLERAGLRARNGKWVLVEVSMQAITVRAAWGHGPASTKRSRS